MLSVPSKSHKQKKFEKKLTFCWHDVSQGQKKQDPDPNLNP
jgi:hypothetical protein